VPPLAVPDPRALLPLDQLMQYEAVQLFVARALAVQPSFRVTPENAPAIVQVCQRLDGIPLAIELAAAQVRVLSVEQLAARLDDALRLLVRGRRTALPRHQTLRALIDWSHALLSEPERVLLRRLSVFAGGWTLEAAEAVTCREAGGACGDFGFQISDFGLEDDASAIQNPKSEIQNEEILELLTRLADKSLVQYEPREGAGRYRLLETIRQYGAEQLGGEERGWIEEQHAAYYLSLAETKVPYLSRADQVGWLDRLEREHDNFRAAFRWSAEQGTGEERWDGDRRPRSPRRSVDPRMDPREVGLRLGAALSKFWSVRGYLAEGRERLAEALALAGAAPTAARARALTGMGNLASAQGDSAVQQALWEECLAIGRELDDREIIASALGNLGQMTYQQGDHRAAQVLLEQSLALGRELGNEEVTANALFGLGLVANYQGDTRAQQALYEESLALWRKQGDQQRVSTILNNLGDMHLRQDDYPAAEACYGESLAIRRELGNHLGIATTLCRLGELALTQGDSRTARDRYEESLAICRERGAKGEMANTLTRLAELASEQDDYERAGSLFRESLGLLQEFPGSWYSIYARLVGLAAVALGQGEMERAARLHGATKALYASKTAPLSAAESARYEGQVASMRAALGEELFAATWAQGQEMTLEAAVAFALEAGTP
jgi:tetratricopeptide (TPR) repeat protein